jgi:hypothetical protein
MGTVWAVIESVAEGVGLHEKMSGKLTLAANTVTNFGDTSDVIW